MRPPPLNAWLVCNPPWPEPPHLPRNCIGWQGNAWLGFQHEAGDDAPRRLARAVLSKAGTVRMDVEQLLRRGSGSR